MNIHKRRTKMRTESKCRMSGLSAKAKFGLPCAIAVIVALYFLLSYKPVQIFIFEKQPLSDDLEYLRKNGITNNLSAVDLDSMDTDQLLVTLHSYLDNIDVICRRKLRLGKIEDGGWEICDDPDVRPQSPCIIYSFGINYDFNFDDDAARLYDCHVYSFDPSMDKLETSNRSDKVHFHKVGLSGHTFSNIWNWKLYTFSDLRAMLGHQKAVISVVKMDIEDSEWESIPNMISTGEMTNIQQFLVEFHVPKSTRSYMLPWLKTIQLIERVGFKKFYVHKNHHCLTLLWRFPVPRTRCYEVYYLKHTIKPS